MKESSELVGSSSKRRDGELSSWIAIETRRRSPEEQPRLDDAVEEAEPMMVSAASLRLSSRIISSTSWCLLATVIEPGRRSSALNRRVSLTVSCVQKDKVSVGRRLVDAPCIETYVR